MLRVSDWERKRTRALQLAHSPIVMRPICNQSLKSTGIVLKLPECLARFRTPPKTFFKNRLYFCCNNVRKLRSLTVSCFTTKGIHLCHT